MKNIGILVVFLATGFLSTKSIWAKLIYLDSLSPLNVLVCRAVLSLPFFLIPMIRFDWNSVNKSKVFKYSFFGAILYLSSSIADFIGLLYISASLERAVLFTFPIYVFLLSSDLSRITFSKVVLIVSTVLGLAIMFNPTVDNHLIDTLIGISLVLLSAIFCSIIPSYLMSFGLKKINASLAAVISAMGPIVTLGLDVVILNHNLALNEIIGAIIVTACVTCLTRLNAKA